MKSNYKTTSIRPWFSIRPWSGPASLVLFFTLSCLSMARWASLFSLVIFWRSVASSVDLELPSPFLALRFCERGREKDRVKAFNNISAILCSGKIFGRSKHLFYSLWRAEIINKQIKYWTTSRTCGNSTACVCYLNWKPVDPPPPNRQMDLWERQA